LFAILFICCDVQNLVLRRHARSAIRKQCVHFQVCAASIIYISSHANFCLSLDADLLCCVFFKATTKTLNDATSQRTPPHPRASHHVRDSHRKRRTTKAAIRSVRGSVRTWRAGTATQHRRRATVRVTTVGLRAISSKTSAFTTQTIHVCRSVPTDMSLTEQIPTVCCDCSFLLLFLLLFFVFVFLIVFNCFALFVWMFRILCCADLHDSEYSDWMFPS
jgi:hypothetical protein